MPSRWLKNGSRCARIGRHVAVQYFTCVDCAVQVEACVECDVCLTSCACDNYQSIDTVTA